MYMKSSMYLNKIFQTVSGTVLLRGHRALTDEEESSGDKCSFSNADYNIVQSILLIMDP